MPGERLEEIWKLRRLMTGDSLEFTDKFIKILRKTKTNADFFASFSEEAFGKGRTNRTIRK